MTNFLKVKGRACFLGGALALVVAAGCSRGSEARAAPAAAEEEAPLAAPDHRPNSENGLPSSTGIVGRGGFSDESLACLARAAGLNVLDEALEPALVRQIAIPAGASVLTRTLGGGQRAALHAYTYPLVGFTRPHVRDIQSDAQDRAWAGAKDRYAIVVETPTKDSSQAIVEAMIQSDCW